MVHPKVLDLWKKQGLTPEQIIARAKSLNTTLPIEFIRDAEPRLNPERKSVKNYVTRGFRPSPRVEKYLSNLPSRQISKFINKAIEFYLDNKLKWN